MRFEGDSGEIRGEIRGRFGGDAREIRGKNGGACVSERRRRRQTKKRTECPQVERKNGCREEEWVCVCVACGKRIREGNTHTSF